MGKIQSRWLKITIAVFVMSVFFVKASPTEAVTVPFTDLNKLDTHYEAIVALYNDGIVNGVTSTKYKPYNFATRGEAALYIANALELDTKNVENPNFKDVPKSSKYYGAIAALVKKGVVKGYSNQTFKPDSSLTRSQLAKMLTLGFDLPISSSLSTNFTDVKKMTDTDGRRYIQTLIDYKITVGTTPVTFSPYAPLLRGQLATFIYRTLGNDGDNLEVISVE